MLKKTAARKTTKKVSADKTAGGKGKVSMKPKVSVGSKVAVKAKVAEKPKGEGREAMKEIPVPETPPRLSFERKEELRKILVEKKQEVWKDVKERLFTRMGKEYHEEVDFSLDEADKATVDLAAETGFSLIDMRKDVLDKIDRALAKLEEGTYGICEDCGAEIHQNRLKVVPFAIYCIECKTRQEEMEKIEREPDRFSVPGQEEMD